MMALRLVRVNDERELREAADHVQPHRGDAQLKTRAASKMQNDQALDRLLDADSSAYLLRDRD